MTLINYMHDSDDTDMFFKYIIFVKCIQPYAIPIIIDYMYRYGAWCSLDAFGIWISSSLAITLYKYFFSIKREP